jgi:E3 ubiquitin-protein ligase HUWE1
MQTGLFLEFEKSGGVEAVVNVCTFCADLIDQYTGIKDDVKTTRDREIMGIAHYFLRHPLIWFYHLASGKPLIESPQTTEIIRYKTYDDFDPAATIVRLRLALLPIFKRFWEAKWLPDTSESVRKAIIFGLLAILRGEYEDSSRPVNTNLAIPGHVPIVRRAPPPPSPAMIQQLTDMGFPEAAARTALTRARGDLNTATEYILANAHLFDGEDTATGDQDEAAEGSNEIATPTSAVAAESTAESAEPSAAVIEVREPEPAPKRDYAKELAEAREELKESIVPNALRLADANPAFIDDIRDVFIGAAMSSNAKVLFKDIKKFSDGVNDIPEIPLQVRCRILALAYLKVGMKGLGLSKDDANELLQSLLALLLAGPVPGTPSQPSLPKWLASHMLLSDRILCSSEDITPVTIMKEGDTTPSGDVFVGPAFTESRKVLFNFCMRLAHIPDLPKDDLLSLFGVLAFLTKDYALASEFVRNGGLALVLEYFKNKRQQDDVAAVSIGIFRHTMEDPLTVEAYMRQDVKRWGSGSRNRPGESVNSYLRSIPHAALRDPKMFIRVTSEMCTLAEAQPGIGGSYRIKVKDEAPSPVAEGKAEVPEASSRRFDEAGLETATTVIHHLTEEFMLQYKQSADQPIAIPASQLANLAPSTGTSGANTPSISDPRPALPALPDVPGSSTKEVDYSRFIHNLLSELLLSYDACKVAFLTYPRKKPLTNVVKEIAKSRSLPMSFLLQELTVVKGDPAEWPKRTTKPNHHHSLIVALCTDANGMTEVSVTNSPIVSVRKCVIESILKALKEPVLPNLTETTEQRYARYIALGDLCYRLLASNPQVQGQRAQEDSLIHMAKIMLDKNFVPTFSAILSEIDLAHPMSGALTSSILAPLEAL